MQRFKRRPSPAMVVAIVALIAAVTGTAIAAAPVTKKTVNKIINNRAPGLSVSKAKSADFATTAGNANNASTLNNLNGNDLASAGSFDTETGEVSLSTTTATVLSASITTPAQKVLTAVSSIALNGDGGANNVFCNVNIDGTDGPHESTELTTNTTLPVTQGIIVGAGTHTVIVECSEDGASDTSVDDRNLSVVATG